MKLRMPIIITGFIAFVLSVVCGIQFYSTLGYDFMGKITYIVAGILLTSLAVLSMTLAAFMFSIGRPIVGVLMSVLWVVLISLEIFAEFGFMAYQQDSKTAENASKSAMATSLRAEIVNIEEQLTKCPSNHYTRCIDPLTKKLNEKNALLQKELSISGTSSSSNIPSVYVWTARIFEIDAKTLQAGTTLLISVLLGLWSSFAGYLVLILKHQQTSEPMQFATQQVEQPQLATKEELSLPTQWQYPSLGSFVKKA
jgi:hypothetical protein